ncbi:MAG: hypothetical protein CL677_10730 [Bdellovibrionaceae bacterium]|nr:hypothetical protein [Pseudobdellovibrionaceae bacterium]|tara:strand:- start:31833 stop:32147 length:315 start_codon:yes stop_codon:yes gene_type:complete
MAQFMIGYFGGNPPASKEEGMAHMEAWKAWVQGLGDKVVNPGTPLPQSKIVTAETVKDDTTGTGMNGFAVIKVDTLDEAVEIAKSDPFLKMGGEIRVSQMMEMS